MQDLFAQNASSLLGLPSAVNLRTAISAGAGSVCKPSREDVTRIPTRAWLAPRGTPFIHWGVSRVSLIPNTRQVKIAQSDVQNGADTRLRRFYYYDAWGRVRNIFLLQLEGKHGKHKEAGERI